MYISDSYLICIMYICGISMRANGGLAGLEGSGSGVMCVLDGCRGVEWAFLYIQLLCSGFILNVR